MPYETLRGTLTQGLRPLPKLSPSQRYKARFCKIPFEPKLPVYGESWCKARSALGLQLKVVAEGAETEEQAAYLRERRCGGRRATTLGSGYPPTNRPDVKEG